MFLDVLCKIFSSAGLYFYINSEYLETYLKEVKLDIQYFKELAEYPKFERDQDLFLRHLIEKYQKSYCPSSFSRWFSLDSEIRFNEYRLQIDCYLNSVENEFSADIPKS